MSRMIGELDIDFDNFRLTNLCGITLNRNPLLDEEVSNKKFIGDELDENTILWLTQTLQHLLKASVENNGFILTKQF